MQEPLCAQSLLILPGSRKCLGLFRSGEPACRQCDLAALLEETLTGRKSEEYEANVKRALASEKQKQSPKFSDDYDDLLDDEDFDDTPTITLTFETVADRELLAVIKRFAGNRPEEKVVLTMLHYLKDFTNLFHLDSEDASVLKTMEGKQ